MASRAQTQTALASCYDAIDELCGSLTEQQWQVASLCPDWDVTGVLTHVAGIESVLDGWFPDSAEARLPFDGLGGFLAEVETLSGPELLDRYRAIVARRREQLDALTDDQWQAPSPTPVGPGTYGRFMEIRVFDCWVHEQDIRVPLGLAGHTTGLAAEISLDEIAGSLGYIVGKKVGLPDGTSIAFHLTGPIERDLYAVVEGRARAVDHLDDPDVAVRTDSLTFALLACGRIDPQGAIDAGTITWTGDDALGDRAARNLAFTF